MERLLFFAVLACAVGAAASAAGAEEQRKPPPSVTITDDGMEFREPYKQGEQEARYGVRLFRFNNGGPQSYGISLVLDQRKQADGTWKTVHSYIGMPIPTEANWYHSGFCALSANGREVQDRDPQAEVADTGQQGMLDFSWDHPLVFARVRIVAEPGSDRLLLELRWQPKPELKALHTTFSCYPQGYRPSEPDRLAGKKLDRHMVTAEREVQQVQTVALNLPAEWWQLYQDNTLEKSPTYNPGGPCALALLPEDADGATVTVGDYAVQTDVELKVAVGRARFALWDFSGKSDLQAKQLLVEQTPALQKRMQSGNWLPNSISSFDAVAESQRVDNLSKEVGKPGATRVVALRKQLAAITGQRAALASAADPLQAERDLRRALTAYRKLFWQAERPVRKTVRTLVLAGPFAYAWRVAQVSKSVWGPDSVRQGSYIWKYWIGHRISYFPSTMEELLSYDVVVLADVPQDPLTLDKRQQLADYVKLGGGLLVLGGPYAYGGGAWKGSPLEPLLPVAIGGTFDLRPSEGDAQLTLTPIGLKRLGQVGSNRKPDIESRRSLLGVVPWHNEVPLRAGAEVWMTAGKGPFAVYAKAGEGRVLALLGTAVGEAPAGRTAFYDSPGWPELLKRMLSYLARGR